MHLRAFTLALGTALLLGPTAHAGQVGIIFDFTGSTISLAGGTIVIPPDGTINSARARVWVQGAGLSTISGGPATLRRLALDSTVDATVLSNNTITGPLNAALATPSVGSLTAGLGNLILPSILLSLDILQSCTGPSCNVLGSFPLSLTGTQLLSGPLSFALGNIGSVGNATIAGSFALSLSGTTALVQLVGNEVDRFEVIPEPHTALLLGLGLAAVATGGRLARRRSSA